MSLVGFPLLLIPFAVYNIFAFLIPGVGWASPVTHVQMASGVEWTMAPGDILIVFSILLLFGEMLKSTRIGMRTVVDHALSMLLFIAMVVEFILVKQAATATFFLLLIISSMDVLAGFAVTLRSAQRGVMIDTDHIPTS
ncbi:MAG: hypothetical protein JO205_13710 [Pseudolabrys sp.]|nr:hypothetical protein [Pseudolabrys sp.]MBV9262416.1 hypothetical protein [Pseudolabrys sp.]